MTTHGTECGEKGRIPATNILKGIAKNGSALSYVGSSSFNEGAKHFCNKLEAALFAPSINLVSNKVA